MWLLWVNKWLTAVPNDIPNHANRPNITFIIHTRFIIHTGSLIIILDTGTF